MAGTTLEIANRVLKSELIKWRELEWLQGGLKEISKASFQKLKQSLISNSLMVACENLGRKCRGIEISPDYCAVILGRMATAFPSLEIKRDVPIDSFAT